MDGRACINFNNSATVPFPSLMYRQLYEAKSHSHYSCTASCTRLTVPFPSLMYRQMLMSHSHHSCTASCTRLTVPFPSLMYRQMLMSHSHHSCTTSCTRHVKHAPGSSRRPTPSIAAPLPLNISARIIRHTGRRPQPRATNIKEELMCQAGRTHVGLTR